MGPIYLRPKRLVRLPIYRHPIAKEYVDLGLSGDECVNWITTQHCLKNKWPIIGRDGNEIEMYDVDNVFGEDPGRWMNSFKLLAVKPGPNLLHKRLVPRIDHLDVAMVIHHRNDHGREDWLIMD